MRSSQIKRTPIYKQTQYRSKFISDVSLYTFNNIKRKYSNNQIKKIIDKTINSELERSSNSNWKVDNEIEISFWKNLKDKYARIIKVGDTRILDEYLLIIIRKYAEELSGKLKISRIRLTSILLKAFLRFTFNRSPLNLFNLIKYNTVSQERWLKINGSIDLVQELSQKGIIVFMPTHQTFLDSHVLAHFSYHYLKLPIFFTASNLMLYNYPFSSYMVKGLGIYPIDKRKKNLIYLNTLKSTPIQSIKWGSNNLIYPEGSFSYTGCIPKQLKKGLIRALVDAQKLLIEEKREEKIFIFPIVLNYHSIPEAEKFSQGILKKTEFNISNYTKIRRWVSKKIGSIYKESEVHVSIGKPIDVLGNFVDNELPANLSVNFFLNESLRSENSRKKLGNKLTEKILERFKKENIVLSSHLLAFTVFNLIRLQFPKLNLIQIVDLPEVFHTIKYSHVAHMVSKMRQELIIMNYKEEIQLSNSIYQDIHSIILEGVDYLGKFNSKKPLAFNQQRNLYTEDLPLLYYYSNRLEGYSFESVLKITSDNVL